MLRWLGKNNTSGHSWERWRPAWHGLFILLTVAALIMTLTDAAAAPAAALPAGLYSGALLAWYALGEHRTGLAWLTSWLSAFAYFLVGWLLWYGAVSTSPAFFLVLFVLFPLAFIRLPLNWAIILAVALNGFVLIAVGHINSDLTATWMLLLTGTSLGGALLAAFIDSIIRQSEERQRLIAELEATRETLAQTEYETGILHERQRLAGELHDTIIQGLIGILMQLEAAAGTNDSAAQRDHIARAQAIARHDLAEARRFISVTDTQTQAVSAQMLEHRLRAALIHSSQTTGVPGVLNVTGSTTASIPHQTAHTVLRVAQEALTNISKHAHATQFTLTLSLMPDCLLLDVHDNGVGFEPVAAAQAGFGLRNMQHRVETVGGSLTIESEPGAPTTLMIALPLPAPSSVEVP